MDGPTYTIGELSRLSGVSVRRLRYYSDEGLLPPAARSGSGYRIYSAEDAARLALIRALREAGLGLSTIRKIMARRLPLKEALAMRLDALESEITSRRRVAAVLRATLRKREPTEDDLRRLWTMTLLSNTQFRVRLEHFFDRIAEDTSLDESWKKQMLDASSPTLPDDPSPEQIDAWIELAEMITDEKYVVQMRAATASIWTSDFDPSAYAEVAQQTFVECRAAVAAGIAPDSPQALRIARDWLVRSAQAMKREPDQAFLDWHAEQYRKHHARSGRYHELMAILRGDDKPESFDAEWRWIHEAMKSLGAPPA